MTRVGGARNDRACVLSLRGAAATRQSRCVQPYQSAARSSCAGFTSSIRATLRARDHDFSCFSRAMAASTSPVSSKCISRVRLYRAVNDRGIFPLPVLEHPSGQIVGYTDVKGGEPGIGHDVNVVRLGVGHCSRREALGVRRDCHAALAMTRGIWGLAMTRAPGLSLRGALATWQSRCLDDVCSRGEIATLRSQ